MLLKTRTIPVEMSYSNLFSKIEELLKLTRTIKPSEEVSDIEFNPMIMWAHAPNGQTPEQAKTCFKMDVKVRERGEVEVTYEKYD
jgi:hypothetical protein